MPPPADILEALSYSDVERIIAAFVHEHILRITALPTELVKAIKLSLRDVRRLGGRTVRHESVTDFERDLVGEQLPLFSDWSNAGEYEGDRVYRWLTHMLANAEEKGLITYRDPWTMQIRMTREDAEALLMENGKRKLLLDFVDLFANTAFANRLAIDFSWKR